jgi:hypothetical protein
MDSLVVRPAGGAGADPDADTVLGYALRAHR